MKRILANMDKQLVSNGVGAWPLLAFENAPIGMLVKSMDWNFVQTNRALREMLGRRAAELAQVDIAELIHRDDRALHTELWKGLCAGKRDSYEIEIRYLHREGHEIWCKVDASLVRDGSGLPQFGITVLEDISDRKHFAGPDRHSAGRYELILNAAGWGICEVNHDGAITFVNAAGARMLGWRADELIGQPVGMIIHPSDGASADGQPDRRPIYATLKDGLTRHLETDIFHCKGGARLPVEYIIVPVIEAGVVRGAAITFAAINRRVEEMRNMPFELEKLSQNDHTSEGK